MRSYKTARGFIWLTQIIGWLAIAVAALLAGISFNGELNIPLLVAAVGVAVGGLLVVVQAQIALAVIDTADNTSKMLAEMKKEGSGRPQGSKSLVAERRPG